VRDLICAAGLILATAFSACAPAKHVAPQSPGDTAAAPPERPVQYQYFFDRNALASADIVGSKVIALTRAGSILRMDRTTLALAGDRFFARRARVMGGADTRSVIVGFEGGRIARIDAASLSDETLGVVPGSPMWVGRSHTGEAVVVFADRRAETSPGWSRFENYRIWLGSRPSAAPIPLPSATSFGGPSDAFLLDRHDRLWHGTDHGEWGGILEVVDLGNGEVQAVPRGEWGGLNVYGFAESSSGQVLGFGGVMHMGFLRTFVAKLEPQSASSLYRYEGMAPFDKAHRQRWLAAPEPHLPITHVLEHANGTFLVLAFNQLIEANSTFNTFRRVHGFALRYSRGRPDAVGSYPAVASAILDGERLLLATQRDGFVEYANGQVSWHALPNQAVGEPVWCLPSPAGVVFVGHEQSSLLTRDGHWKAVPLELANLQDGPSLEPDPAIKDPDVLAARSAFEARLRSPDYAPGSPPRLRLDSRTDLLAAEQGLCLQRRGEGACLPFNMPGVGRVFALARDGDGRIWLAGEGLWFIDNAGRAIPVHPRLPFMIDATVHDIAVADSSLALLLGARGVAIVDIASATR
jgi:hypothetical protein